METADLAAIHGRRPEEIEARLGKACSMTAEEVADSPGNPWFSPRRFEDTLRYILGNLYALNGGVIRRQAKGVPMGLECSPQLTNLYAYSVESVWVDTAKPDNLLMMRFIDDILIMGNEALTPGVGLPSEEDYAMKYKLTSEATNSLIYLGVRFFVDDRGEAHCVLHDRAVEYPIVIDRYPEASTVANPAQLAGVIMGRLVSAQRLCSRMDLFQDAVAGIFTTRTGGGIRGGWSTPCGPGTYRGIGARHPSTPRSYGGGSTGRGRTYARWKGADQAPWPTQRTARTRRAQTWAEKAAPGRDSSPTLPKIRRQARPRGLGGTHRAYGRSRPRPRGKQVAHNKRHGGPAQRKQMYMADPTPTRPTTTTKRRRATRSAPHSRAAGRGRTSWTSPTS